MGLEVCSHNLIYSDCHTSFLVPIPYIAELTEVGAASDSGTVPVQCVLAALRPNTSLVSIMLANNETGVIQPVGEVVEGLKKSVGEKGGRIFVHTDAAQVKRCGHS